MKIRIVLGLLLVLVVLVWSFNLFYIPSGSGDVVSSGAPILVVVAKQDYVYARVELVIQPFVTGNQQLSITFPNGTVRALMTDTTIDITIPNTSYYAFFHSVSGGAPACITTGGPEPGCVTVAPSSGGQACYASPTRPLCVSILSVANATESYATVSAPIEGIHAYQYLINGTGAADVQIEAWSVSL